MTVEQHDAEAGLRRAFKSYLYGAVPPDWEMAQAPLLDNWRVAIVHVELEAGPSMLAVLVGSVTGHPRYGGIKTIRTSQLVWLDRGGGWARTWNRVYRLGNRAGNNIDSGVAEVGT